MGDLYFSVAEAWMAVADYARACSVLQLLLSAEEFNKPAIWIRYARCLKEINRLEESLDYYLQGEKNNKKISS